MQNIYPSKREDSDFMLDKLSEETKNIVKTSSSEKIQNTLTKRINTLENINSKLIEENLRLKTENEHLKNNNQLKKDSEPQFLKTEKKLTPWLSIIKNEENLNVEEIGNTSLFLNLKYVIS